MYAEPGPTMEEGRIAGDSVMFGPEVVRLAEEDEEQVSIVAAINNYGNCRGGGGGPAPRGVGGAL